MDKHKRSVIKAGFLLLFTIGFFILLGFGLARDNSFHKILGIIGSIFGIGDILIDKNVRYIVWGMLKDMQPEKDNDKEKLEINQFFDNRGAKFGNFEANPRINTSKKDK